MTEFEQVLVDAQKEVSRSNRVKDKIIILLIVLMFLEAILGYAGFLWYESQFEITETQTTTTEISTSGENANATYNENDVETQYNDSEVYNNTEKPKEGDN